MMTVRGGETFVSGGARSSDTRRWPWLQPFPGPADHKNHLLRTGHLMKSHSQIMQAWQSLSYPFLPSSTNTAISWRGAGFWERKNSVLRSQARQEPNSRKGLRLSGFASLSYHSPAVGPYASYLKSLCLNFCFCKMEINNDIYLIGFL